MQRNAITHTSETDVLVIGAGPVGLMLACELSRRSIACRIIDTVSDFPQTSRANGLQPRSLEVLDSLGVVDQIVARGYPVHGASVMQGGHEFFRLEMKLDQGGHPTPRPDQPYRSVVLVNQAMVEGVLCEKLLSLGGQVERQRELRSFEETSGGLVAQVVDLASEEVERVEAKWLVGCDGAHSTVRRQLQLPMEGQAYPEHLVLADVHLQGDLPQGVTIMWLNDQGLLAGMPFPEPGLWRLMAVVTPDAQGDVPKASVALFQRLLAERAGDTTTKLGQPVALVVNGTAPEALLDTYEAERLPVARQVLKETDINQRLGIAQSRMAEFLRNHVVFPLLSIPALREPVIEFALRRGSELDINYRSSSLSEQHDHFRGGPQAGDRAPDGQLLDRAGQSTTLFSHFRTPHFSLLLFGGHSSAADVAELARIRQRLGEASGGLIRAYLIVGPQDSTDVPADDLTRLCDPNHSTHQTYGASSPCLYLVRPDGYVGFRSHTADESRLIDYIRRNLALG
jgi:2-polyprenyl-6-methoxyphenol hydroxylase-like FAD-dependent oxidoreductase